MLPPTNTTVTYDRPGTMAINTPGVSGSGGSGPIDMNSLYEMFKYKAATKAWEAQRQAALADREMRLREQMQAAQLAAMQPKPEQGGEGGVAGRLQQLALRKAQGEVMDADSIRNLRKVPVPMGPGGIYGTAYDWDTRSMNPIQQQAVSPNNAVAANEGMSAQDTMNTIAAQGAARSGAPPPGSLEDYIVRKAMFSSPSVFIPQR